MPNTWIDPMIYDRTAEDVTNRAAKAFINVADWLRIYGNARIANQLTNLYLTLSVPFTELAAPTITSFPSADDVNSLVENIDLCRAAASLPSATGILPLDHAYQAGVGAEAPDYTDVNAWERDVQLIRDCLRGIVDQTISCGVGNCGQARFWQVRFRVWTFVPPAVSPVRRPRCGIVTTGTAMMRQNLWRKY